MSSSLRTAMKYCLPFLSVHVRRHNNSSPAHSIVWSLETQFKMKILLYMFVGGGLFWFFLSKWTQNRLHFSGAYVKPHSASLLSYRIGLTRWVDSTILVARRANNRKVVGLMPANVECITVLTGNCLGWTVRCGRPPLLLPCCKKLKFKTVSVDWLRSGMGKW